MYKLIAEAVAVYESESLDISLDEFVEQYLREAQEAEQDYLDNYYDPYAYQQDIIDMYKRER